MGLFAEEGGQFTFRKFSEIGWGRPREVAGQASSHLASHGIEISAEVGRADEEAPRANLGLKDQPEFLISGEGVDGLDNRLDVFDLI